MLQKQTTEKLQNMVVTVSDKPQLESFAWPGGYLIIYYAQDTAVICSECANGGNDAEFQNPECQDDAQWTLADCDIYYEGPPLYCEHCNRQLESAYDDPEETTATA